MYRCKPFHISDETLNIALHVALLLESCSAGKVGSHSHESPHGLVGSRWDCDCWTWQARTDGSRQEPIYGLLGLCCHNWLNPLSGLSQANVLNETTLGRLIQPPPAWGVLSFWCGVWLKPAFVCFRLDLCMCVWSCTCTEHLKGDWKDIVIASWVDYRMYWLTRKVRKVGSAMKQRSWPSFTTGSRL